MHFLQLLSLSFYLFLTIN